jgi:murein DD-endopeptidase MepM/ murein hydrolase activator NlpD
MAVVARAAVAVLCCAVSAGTAVAESSPGMLAAWLGMPSGVRPAGMQTKASVPAPERAMRARIIGLAAPEVRPALPAVRVASPVGHLALLRPSSGAVTSRFGWRVHPIFGGREFHTGMDIATSYGSPVVASRAGVVRFVGWRSGYGRIIVLVHEGGVETAYSHLSAAVVNRGERVGRGQMIGRIGSSGWSTGPHLFFEVRRHGVPLDPERYLD